MGKQRFSETLGQLRNIELKATSFLASYGSSPGLGDFSVEEDRLKTALVLKQVLLRRMRLSLQRGDFTTYRVVLNAQAALFKGLPVEPISGLVPGFEQLENGPKSLVAEFLHQNGFRYPLEYDNAGWSPLCYACMKGDSAKARQKWLENGFLTRRCCKFPSFYFMFHFLLHGVLHFHSGIIRSAF